MSFRLVNVGIADLQVVSSPDVLRTILGSCIGICLYDSEHRIAGISHIMLPEQRLKDSNPLKYADTAIPILLDKMRQAGAESMIAKLVGGATMFKLSKGSQMGEIGKNNLKKVIEILQENKINIIRKDVGGDYGRTIDFYAKNGEITIKSLGKEIKVI